MLYATDIEAFCYLWYNSGANNIIEGLGFMNYITAKEFSLNNNLGLRNVQKMCKSGKIHNAQKIGGVWMIPSDYQLDNHTSSAVSTEKSDELIKNFLAEFSVNGKNAPFDELDDKMKSGDLKTKAECLMLKSYMDFPNIEKMGEKWIECRDLLKGTGIKLENLSLMFGGSMLKGIFLYETGIVDKCKENFQKYIPVYDEIIGRKSGIDLLFESEIEYMRGNIQKAEILAYKLYYTDNLDWEVKLGVADSLAHIALLMYDSNEFDLARILFEKVYSECKTDYMKTSFEISASIIRLMIFDTDAIPEWLKQGYFADKKMTITTRLNAIFVHLSCLMKNGEYSRTIALAEKLIDEINGGAENVTYYSLVYLYIISSICCYAIDCPEKGDAYLVKAVELVKEDEIFMVLYEYASVFGENLDRVLLEYEPDKYDKYCEINEKFIKNKRAMLASFQKEDLVDILTETERQVAALICDGLSNAEISEKLYISLSTVNYHIRNIYSKVGARRRTEMIKKLGDIRS